MKISFIKLLKKIKLLRKFNFSFSNTFNGKKIIIPIINGVGTELLSIERSWLDSLIEVFCNKNEQRTFVDIGANIGQTMLRFKTQFPENKYLGFEPNSTCTAYSQKLSLVNSFQNCVVLNVALSSKLDILILGKERDISLAGTVVPLVIENESSYFTMKEHILAVDYQQLFLNENIEFVKINVERSELEVLQGMKDAILKFSPIIVCEVLDSDGEEMMEFTQNRATEICSLLKSIKYEMIQLHTNNTDKLSSYKKVEEIKIQLFTRESLDLNNYLLYPKGKENWVVEQLNKVTKL